MANKGQVSTIFKSKVKFPKSELMVGETGCKKKDKGK
jgi:hypothetical protein